MKTTIKCKCCNGGGGMTIMKATEGIIKVVYPYRTTCDQCEGEGFIKKGEIASGN